MDFYNFYSGREFEAYQYLGAHVVKDGVVFRTFAPAAQRISVIGEFNCWQETPMNRVYDGNFWECYIKEAEVGMMYKYRIYRQDGTCIDHADPYGFFAELRPRTASIIYDLTRYTFHDRAWMKTRKCWKDGPVNIYEVHFGSWKRRSDGAEEWYSYEEMADLLIPYIKEHGYNYVELMPLGEYPCDESWGYQATGFFSPTSRYGEPDGLRRFVDQCHKEKIGVILDFVPVHFAVNDYGLMRYDGTALYEYPHVHVGYNEWGSHNFMHSRSEVCSFLQSSAYYWLKEYHIDGLRMDAVSNLIYWQGDTGRGENKDAIRFLQNMNTGLKERMDDILLIAEDSSAYPKVTAPAAEGGLGFDYKWDMGWMNDTLSYFQAATPERRVKYHKLTFSMHYFYNEKYLLPLSHDEVVHGKATIIQKMNGDYEQKFSQARAFYLYMYAHPGKKLNFMGNELGQLREWDEKREQDWGILAYPIHDAFCHLISDLNRLYLKYPALYRLDYDRRGFRWIDCGQEQKCVYVFERSDGSQRILSVFNFSDEEQIYEYRTEKKQTYQLLIASDMEEYGGERKYSETKTVFTADKVKFSLSPFSGRYYSVRQLLKS